MKYMLMMNTPRDTSSGILSWPQSDFHAHIEFMKNFSRQLAAAGELVAAEGLSMPDQALRVRAGQDGQPITDGVFPEAKEFLIGYWIVDVETRARALAIAAQASAAPGRGGAPLNMPIEVREIMSGPPPDLA